MNRAGVFAITGVAAAVASVVGEMATGKSGKKMVAQPYAAAGAGLATTAAAAIMWKPTVCSCPPGAPATTVPTISRSGFGAAVALASIVGGVIGAAALTGSKGPKILGQRPYAAVGAAVAGAGIAAALWPDPAVCPPCTLPPATTATPPAAGGGTVTASFPVPR